MLKLISDYPPYFETNVLGVCPPIMISSSFFFWGGGGGVISKLVHRYVGPPLSRYTCIG